VTCTIRTVNDATDFNFNFLQDYFVSIKAEGLSVQCVQVCWVEVHVFIKLSCLTDTARAVELVPKVRQI